MRTHRIWSLVVTLFIGVLGATVAVAALEGARAPDFVLKSATGSNLRLSEYRGQVVMVTFWASWCGLEGLATLHERYAGAGFEMLAVGFDTERDKTVETAEDLGLGFPVLHDPDGAVGELYEVGSLPVVILIDRDGFVRETFDGYRPGDEERYLERIRLLLGE